MKWENLLVVLDKQTSRLVYRSAWAEWPQMIPTTPDYAVRQWRGFNDWTEADWTNFEITWPDVNQGAVRANPAKTLPLTEQDLVRLQMEREKCALAWRWLNVMYALNRSVTGMIPGIDVAPTLAEENLLLEERTQVQNMIKNDILVYWPKIWSASTMAEVEAIGTELKSVSRNSQAFA